jgi:hypothetical protein
MVSIGSTQRHRLFVAALGGLGALVLLGAAPVLPPGKPQSAPEATPAPAKPDGDGGESPSTYEREALAVDRVANGIAERANLIAETQRSYAFWQLILGGCGVAFTGFAAFFAYRATHWAKAAAQAARESATADNTALAEARAAAEEARKDALKRDKQFAEQLALSQETMEYTARSSRAMETSATATRRMASATSAAAKDQLRPYVYIFGESISVSVFFAGGTIVGDIAAIGFSIKNFGQTPAKQVRIKVRAFIGENIAAGEPIAFDDRPTVNRADLPPGFDREIKGCEIDGMALAYASILLGERAVFVEGLIEYEDAGGGKYETHFRRSCSGKQIETGTFAITEDGNEAT